MIFNLGNFSKKQIISFIAIASILFVIPFTLVFLQRTQIIKQNALESTITCHTEDPAYPDGYDYSPGALEVWVVKSDGPGSTNEIGTIPGVKVHAQALRNNLPPVGSPNRARTDKDGPGCGFSADGTTDSNGFTHLEPLNCGHNNFALSTSDLPSNVIWIGSTYNNGLLNEVDISNLDLRNGTTDVVKLYYYEAQSVPTPTATLPPDQPTPTPTAPDVPTPTPTLPPTCVYTDTVCGGGTPLENNNYCTSQTIDSDWCFNGKCISCAVPPPPTSTPTPTICPIPATVTNISITCPFCP